MAILFNRAEEFEQFLKTVTSGTFLYDYFKTHALAKEEKSFEGFSTFSSGGHLVQRSGTVQAILVDGHLVQRSGTVQAILVESHLRNIPVK